MTTPQNNGHSVYSPSKAHRYMRCPGSVALEGTCKDTSSEYAKEGTAAHALAEMLITGEIKTASAMIGREVQWEENGQLEIWIVDEDMADNVQRYVDTVFARVEEFKLLPKVKAVRLHAEQRVDFSAVIGIKDQFGTADVVIEVEFEDDTVLLSVEDLKYGRGVVVDAEDNEQLMTYGAGVMSAYELVGYDVTRVNVAIHQIRLNHISEHEYTAAEIRGFGKDLAIQAKIAEHNRERFKAGEIDANGLVLSAGEKQCKFCKAKAKCPAARGLAAATVYGGKTPVSAEEFDDLDDEPVTDTLKKQGAEGLVSEHDWLAACLNHVDFIEDWCKAIRSEVFDRLNAGENIPGYKLVAGKRGARQWDDKTAAEETLKSMRLKQDEMYTLSLISPTQAEKILKDSPRRWNRLQPLIVQKEGSPHVAPESDKRPALNVRAAADDFDDLTDAEDLV